MITMLKPSSCISSTTFTHYSGFIALMESRSSAMNPPLSGGGSIIDNIARVVTVAMKLLRSSGSRAPLYAELCLVT
jgi:hypothetical protein